MSATPPVTTSADLLHALARLAPGDFVALDTEFMRESTYFPKLCLIQAATSDACAVLDPLALPDLAPLWQFLAIARRTKVLHAARQDLEVLTTATRGQPVPGPIFDTQIAAALLGHPAQIGYGSLVAERLGHTLAKGHTRTDWTRRPLTPEQLQYAEDDVRYLVPLYLESARGAAKPRDGSSGCTKRRASSKSSTCIGTDPDAAWRRLKGLDRLQPQQRATAKLLAQWREAAAIKHDKPRGWILADDALREIAERCPARFAISKQIRSLPPGVVRRRGEEMLALIERGRGRRSQRSCREHPPRPQPQQLALVTKLMNLARETAQHAKINAGGARHATRRRTTGVRATHRAPAAAAGDARSSASRCSPPHDSRDWSS